MFSELLRIPYQWAGVPIFGFGVLLAVWAIATAWIMVRLIQQYGWSAETWSYVPVLLLVGAAIVLLPRFFPDGLPIRGYGTMVLIGATAGIALASHRAKQVGLESEVIFSLAFVMFVCGIVAARLFYVIEYWDTTFRAPSWRDTFAKVLAYAEGGLVVYGALIGAGVAFVWFVRHHKLPALAMADLIAPSLVVGLAIGRLGCFLNGCCYGGPSSLPWAVTFPIYGSRYEAGTDRPEGRLPRYSPAYADQAARGEMHGFRLQEDREGRIVVSDVRPNTPAAASGLEAGDEVATINGAAVANRRQAEAIVLTVFSDQLDLEIGLRSGRTVWIPAVTPPARSYPVHPTQLYSAVNAGLLAWLLWAYYPFRRRDGEMIAMLLTVYPVSRFLLEIIRVDESPVFGTGLSISQNISLVTLLGAAGLWVYLLRQPRRLAFADDVAT